jgi:hypothetical protein
MLVAATGCLRRRQFIGSDLVIHPGLLVKVTVCSVLTIKSGMWAREGLDRN